MLKKHAILTAIGLVGGLLALAWIQPLTSAGASLLLLVVVVMLNAVAALPVRGLVKAFKPARPSPIKSAKAKRRKSAEANAGKRAREKAQLAEQ